MSPKQTEDREEFPLKNSNRNGMSVIFLFQGALVHSDQSGKKITASLATVGREHSSTMESQLKI